MPITGMREFTLQQNITIWNLNTKIRSDFQVWSNHFLRILMKHEAGHKMFIIIFNVAQTSLILTCIADEKKLFRNIHHFTIFTGINALYVYLTYYNYWGNGWRDRVNGFLLFTNKPTDERTLRENGHRITCYRIYQIVLLWLGLDRSGCLKSTTSMRNTKFNMCMIWLFLL